VNLKLRNSIFSTLLLFFCSIYGQNVSLYQQFNGNYDYTFIGNTMNVAENNPSPFYVTETSSSANLILNSNDTLVKAYLYWAGSGDGDFNVDLNGTPITADRTFSHSRFFDPSTFTYFSAFKDITSLVATNGNGIYTLSNLDISPFEVLHYSRKTNFAGWAILIIYQNNNLPLNQLNVYDGLQGVPDNLEINLTNLNVLNTINASVGFIAWEGDNGLSTESFKVNGEILSNLLNPANNVFNGTNSITNETNLYNMDLDIYNIENYIAIGDTNATITLSSWQDFIMINTVVTKLNSQMPDATISIDNIFQQCNSNQITIDYTVFNNISTNELASGVPISIYINGILITTMLTTVSIPINGSWNSQISVEVPEDISEGTIKFSVDDIGTGIGIITELNEFNNTDQTNFVLQISPKFNALEPILSCNQGLTSATFDFLNYNELVLSNSTDIFEGFFESYEDAENRTNEILDPSNFIASATPKEIFIRIKNESCYAITSFLLKSRNCPPTVYNFISDNGDGDNDSFFIEGLRDIFVNFKLEIYNRWGQLVWKGSNDTDDWKGSSNEGIRLNHTSVPIGTYYYILYLNDTDFPKPIIGYLYYTK